MIALLLPVFVCVFVIGWIMYWVGESATSHKTTQAKTVKDNVTIGAIVLEENEEILAV